MTGLTYFDADLVTARTPWPALIDAIRDAFRHGGVSPIRHSHSIPCNDRDDDITLLLMPAWTGAGNFGVKLTTISPANAAFGQPTINGLYVLFSSKTGIPIALFDAGVLTARRTAAASAFASRCLSRTDSATLLMIGTGRLARQLIAAHCSVRPIEEVRIWGRTEEKARDLAKNVSQDIGVDCRVVPDIESSAPDADIISTATRSDTPLLCGCWVSPGTHIDLVGAYTPDMREADTALVNKADRIFVDTMDGATSEAGELIQAAFDSDFTFEDITGDMYMLSSQEGDFRSHREEITVYKSVGTALQGLAAAQLCVRHTGTGNAPC